MKPDLKLPPKPQPAPSVLVEIEQRRNRRPSNLKQWRKVGEFAIVGFATWLNPQAGLLIFLLKLSFQVLWTLQDREEERKK